MRAGALAIALVTLAVPTQAQSEVPAELDLPPWARAERSHAGLDVEVWPASSGAGANQLALVFEPFVQVMISEHWAVTGSIPFGYFERRSEQLTQTSQAGPVVVEGDSLSSQSAFVVGSVTIGGHYTTNVAQDHLNLWAGLRLAVPTMLMEGGDGVTSATDAQRAAPNLNAIRAGTHAHRFTVMQIGVRPEMGLEWLIPADWLYVRSTLAPLVRAPVSRTADVDAGLDHITEVEIRTYFGLGGGLGFREAFAFTAEDKVRTAIEPLLGYESSGSGFMARFGLLVGLDHDDGVPVRGDVSTPNASGSTFIDNQLASTGVVPRTVTPRLRVGGTW